MQYKRSDKLLCTALSENMGNGSWVSYLYFLQLEMPIVDLNSYIILEDLGREAVQRVMHDAQGLPSETN